MLNVKKANENDEGLKALLKLKELALELGVDPVVFASKLIENLKLAIVTYPDDRQKAIETAGVALYKEF